MKRILAVDINDCTGCRICELICAFEKGEGCNPAKGRIKIIKADESGVDVPAICQHCEDPACQDVCPVEAIQRDSGTGAVLLEEDVCTGCKACASVCPYGAITMNTDRGVMVKCDLCNGNPQCVEFCPKGALAYERPDVIEARRREKKYKRIINAARKARDEDRRPKD